jgi:polysaccharide export outer membrane protein
VTVAYFRRTLARAVRALVAVGFPTLLLGALAGCAGAGQFTWFRDLPKNPSAPASGEYVIGVGDTLNVRVYEQPALTTDVKIRSDGRIGLPFIGEVVAVGKSPVSLAHEIQTRFTQFIVNPSVTVNVASSPPVPVSVMGEVVRPGALTVERSTGLLQVLAQAGGFTDFADKSKIFVVRSVPDFQRIRFTYDGLVENRDGAASFWLQTGDVVIVQ